MDCLLIGFISLPNRFLYTQFHPLAFVVKVCASSTYLNHFSYDQLNIEVAMFNLIVRVAQSTGLTEENELHVTTFPTGSDVERQTPSATGELSNHGALRDVAFGVLLLTLDVL